MIRKALLAKAQSVLGKQKNMFGRTWIICPIAEILRKTASPHTISLKSATG